MNLFGFDVPLWALLLGLVIYVYYKYLTWNYGIFKNLGVRGPHPLPFLGNLYSLLKKGIYKHDAELIKNYGKVSGFFQGRTPIMMVADTAMLKEILVKRFDCFQNRRAFSLNTEAPMNMMMTMLKDDHWKHVRHLLSPTFSAGKLKKMNALINHSGSVLVKNLLEKAQKDEVVEFRETASFFTMDVIGSTSFGILVDSQSDPDNEFTRMANKALRGRFLTTFIYLLAPSLFKYVARFGITFFPKDVKEFFIGITKKAMEARDAESEERADLLQLMLNARSDDVITDIGGIGGDVSHLAVDETGVWSKKALTQDEIAAQTLLFFMAGHHTTGGLISFLVYNLAVNPDCQDTLIQEIDTVMEGHSLPSYELVQKMTYMEMCINESLRIYPPGPRTDRICQKDVTINGQFIPEGMAIVIPMSHLHYDPSVWPEPHVFRPERFSPEEKATRDPYYHMPFGYGPRSCIAMRLALFIGKMCMVHILQNFRVVTCAETQVPLEIHKFQATATKGIHVKLQRREAHWNELDFDCSNTRRVFSEARLERS